MTTAADLVTEAIKLLHGYGSTSDRITPLNSVMGPSDTSFTVDFTSGQSVGISPGQIEIDSELMWVVSVDGTSATVTLADGFGRGYNSTTPASHALGAKVVSRPRWPRYDMFRLLNEVTTSLYPDLFQVKEENDLVVAAVTNTYTLATTPLSILNVEWQDYTGGWNKVWSYSVEPYDNTLRLGDGGFTSPMPGQPLRVIYTAKVLPFTAETDDISVTGLSSSCADLLVMGMVARAAVGLDLARAQTRTPDAASRSKDVPPNAGITASQFLMKLYTDRLQREAQSLRSDWQPRMRHVY